MIVLLGFRVFRGFVLYALKQIDVEDKQFMHRSYPYTCYIPEIPNKKKTGYGYLKKKSQRAENPS